MRVTLLAVPLVLGACGSNPYEVGGPGIRVLEPQCSIATSERVLPVAQASEAVGFDLSQTIEAFGSVEQKIAFADGRQASVVLTMASDGNAAIPSFADERCEARVRVPVSVTIRTSDEDLDHTFSSTIEIFDPIYSEWLTVADRAPLGGDFDLADFVDPGFVQNFNRAREAGFVIRGWRAGEASSGELSAWYAVESADAVGRVSAFLAAWGDE